MQIFLKGRMNVAKKQQAKYTPLRLVDWYGEAIRKLEEIRFATDAVAGEERVQAAVDYSVQQIYKLNGLREGQKLTEAQKQSVLYQSYDYAIATVVTADWRYSKQVYTFSKDFYEMLLDMDDFEIGWSLFDQLPYDSFYLELQGHEELAGILVKYNREPARSILYVICDKGDNIVNVNSGIINPRPNSSYKSFFETEVYASKADLNAPEVVLVRQALSFMLQACMYLCAKNADIEENEEQKRVYRPSKTIKNKFSEVRKWDVGVRVIREHNAAKNNNEVKAISDGENNRRRPRQHWRKAHWHTYWVGPKTEQTKVVKFIAPILVNDNKDEMPVVIHQ